MLLRGGLTRGVRTLTARSGSQIRSQATAADTLASHVKPLKSILIANRGEIALRVGRTAAEHGIRTTTIYTDPDAQSQHALSSPFAVNLGAPSAYLDGAKIIEVARDQQCDAIHPGYGFLSENSAFARSCVEAGIVFIGPPWEAIEAMGNKSRSKEIMIDAGVPCIPGYHGGNQDPSFLASEADKIGYPVLLKAVKGGGGKGMRISQSPADFASQLESAKSEARNSFGDDAMLVEKYITTPRHVEVQVFADQHGNCVALGERDCSIQRRHQKIIEESPAPRLDDSVRKDLWTKACAAAIAVKYEGAGTVEFIFDNDTGKFYFMEMNTRLQVEHPATEMVTGLDLVQWQIAVAEGHHLPLNQAEVEARIAKAGWAFEARIYAENPEMNFMPDSGRLIHLREPQTSSDVRIDAGFVAGDEVSSHYDPMIAKLIVRGPTRHDALRKLRAALEHYEVVGPATNIEFLRRICVSPAFVNGEVETGYIQKHHDELFVRESIPPEAWAQAALGVLAQEREDAVRSHRHDLLPAGDAVGFDSSFRSRALHFNEILPDNTPGAAQSVEVHQTSHDTFDIKVNEHVFTNVRTHRQGSTILESYFPHTRIKSTVVRHDGKLTLFQRGQQYRMQETLPKWTEKALGLKDITNSVLAPMPCKVLRVDVKEGDDVQKDQPLVVIESMKMETVIKSPQDGRIARVVHHAGDICKAGTALVEFEAAGEAP